MAGGFSVTIRAVDAASAKLEQINKKIAALSAPAERLQASFKRLSDASGLTKVVKGFENLGRMALNAFRSVSRIVAPLGAITGALSVAGMYKLVSSWAEFGERLGITSQRIGLSATQLQSLQGAAQLAGASSDSLTSGLTHLQDTLTDAVGGRAPEAVVLMDTLKISWRDGEKAARSVTDVLPQLADKIAAIPNPSLRARAATLLLGGAAEDLLPFIDRGSAGIADLIQTVQKYGHVTDEQIKKAAELRESQAKLNIAVEQFTFSVAARLAPILGPIIDTMADWVSVNGKWVGQDIATQVQKLSDYLNNGGWKEIGDDVKNIATSFKAVADAVGGVTNAVEILFGLWAYSKIEPVLSLMLRVAAGIGGIVAAVTGLPAWVVGLIAGGSGALSYAANKEIYKDSGGSMVGVDGEGRPIWANPQNPGSGSRGMRNNNPLNLSYAGQAGTVGTDGRFGIYSSMQDGIAAAERQLLKYQERGKSSLKSIIGTWAPRSENDTDAYVKAVAARTGFDPNANLNMHNPKIASAVIAAMARQENGSDVDPGIVAQGVAKALGQPVQIAGVGGAAGVAGANGNVKLDIGITHDGGNVSTRSVSDGNVTVAPPSVARIMPMSGP
jgi:hypothetical protein